MNEIFSFIRLNNFLSFYIIDIRRGHKDYECKNCQNLVNLFWLCLKTANPLIFLWNNEVCNAMNMCSVSTDANPHSEGGAFYRSLEVRYAD